MTRRKATPLVQTEDQSRSRAWARQFLSDAAQVPISLVLDGKTVRGIPAAWQPTVMTRRLTADVVERVFMGRDPQSGLEVRVECTLYQGFPVVEWVAWFTNRSGETTPILRDILALDSSFAGSKPVLYHCNGDFYSADGYTPTETALGAGEQVALAPNNGRPSDGAFPYTRIRFADGGLSLAVGWPGQWAASFAGSSDGVQVRAGQEKTHLRLLPGESIRTPRMTLLFWTGDDSRAINLWRRWYLAHILPRPNDLPLQPLLTCSGTDEGEEFTGATEENQVRYIEKMRQMGFDFDVWWIDAGWYPCYNSEGIRRWPITGTWRPDAERFPNGLKPISDHAAKHNANLLIWFEPERVRPGTQLDREHPEWLLDAQGTENRLLFLGNPAARQWLTDHVNQLIQENGIGIYRQDFNFPPLPHWRQNEAENRQGMNENLHVQGYLRFWDELLEHNPELWIDSCSSGGRRNDLETMRRSVPLHYTDYGYGDLPVKLAFQHTLLAWIPYFKEVTLSWDLTGNALYDQQMDPYAYYGAMAPMLSIAMDARRDDYDYASAGRLVEVWRRASDLLLFGDYYPLTPFSKSDQAWVVRQFDDSQSGRGLVQAIRLPNARQESFTAHPRAIQPDATYRFENSETGDVQEISGEQLRRDGLRLELPARSGAIWFYHQLNRI